MGLWNKLGFGSKDPIKTLNAMNADRLRKLGAGIEYDLNATDARLDAMERDIHRLVKEGVGAPQRKKLRLAAQARARNVELQQHSNSYQDQVMMFAITNTLGALKSSHQSLNSSQLAQLQGLLGVRNVRELQAVLRELHATEATYQAPIADLYKALEDYSQRAPASTLIENDYVRIMDELESVKDASDFDDRIRRKVAAKIDHPLADSAAA